MQLLLSTSFLATSIMIVEEGPTSPNIDAEDVSPPAPFDEIVDSIIDVEGASPPSPASVVGDNDHPSYTSGIAEDIDSLPRTTPVSRRRNISRKWHCLALATGLVLVGIALAIGFVLQPKEVMTSSMSTVAAEIGLKVTRSTENEVGVEASDVGIFTLTPTGISFITAEVVNGTRHGFSVPFPGDMVVGLTDALAIMLADFLLLQIRAAIALSNGDNSDNWHRRLDSPGCDWFPDVGCNLNCCAVHDECFDVNNCTALSWTKTICENPVETIAMATSIGLGKLGVLSCVAGYLSGITSTCVQCNNVAASCIAAGCSGIEDPSLDKRCYDNKCHEYFGCPDVDTGKTNWLEDQCGCKTPGTNCSSPATCGNGICDKGETNRNCSVDCTYNSCMDPTGLNCGGSCIDPFFDKKNCGTCGFRCGPDEVCTDGACACRSGLERCNGVWCTNPSTDAENCGECGLICSPPQGCYSGACTCPVDWKPCNGDCIHPLKTCSSGVATSPPSTAISTDKISTRTPTVQPSRPPTTFLSTWPPTTLSTNIDCPVGWKPCNGDCIFLLKTCSSEIAPTPPPTELWTWPPTLSSSSDATTETPTVYHGACPCSSCCEKEDCNYMAACFPYDSLYDDYECSEGELCDGVNPCSGVCTPTCASMGGCCVDTDCDILNSESPWDTNDYTCVGGELCDRQHPCSGACVPAVCPKYSCCTNEDCIYHDGYIYECDVEGVICDERNPCSGTCYLEL